MSVKNNYITISPFSSLIFNNYHFLNVKYMKYESK